MFTNYYLQMSRSDLETFWKNKKLDLVLTKSNIFNIIIKYKNELKYYGLQTNLLLPIAHPHVDAVRLRVIWLHDPAAPVEIACTDKKSRLLPKTRFTWHTLGVFTRGTTM